MALPPLTPDPFTDPADEELAAASEVLPPATWHGLDIPAAPPLPTPAVSAELAPAVPLLPLPPEPAPATPLPFPGSAAVPTPPPTPLTPSAAPEQLVTPEPFPRTSLEDVQARITPPATVPEPERAPEAAAQQAEFVAETAATQATREADYLRSFADRMREVNEADRLAREQVASRVETIDAQLRQDQDEIRALTREQGKLSPDARVGTLVAGGLQALKALIGAGKADTSVIDRIVQQDAEQKAAALQGARERADITAGQRQSALGRLQELDYLRQTAVATTWEQIATELDADAAAAKDSVAKLQLATAADRARASAIQARNEAMRLAADREIERTRKGFETDILGAKAAGAPAREEAEIRKLEAEALRAERRARGNGRKTKFSVEEQLRGLGKEDRERVEERGIRGSAGDFLRTPDGTFVIARDKEDAKQLATQWAGVQTVNDSLKRLEALRQKYGHEWDISNSAALQDMQSTMAELELTLKDVYNMGVLSDSDLEMLRKITGGDPSGWFDKRPTWAAMRSRMEGAFNRKLRARTNYKGQFQLDKFRGVERKLEDISRPLDAPYDPVSGNVIDTQTRLAALDEERQRLVTEGGTAGGLRLATELAVERASARVNENHRALMARMQSDLEKARAANDTQRAQTIQKSMDEQRQFAAAAGRWAAEQKAKLPTLEQEQAAEAKRAQQQEIERIFPTK